MLFIIGNGFDMSLGLDTSYDSFLQWYISCAVDDEPDSVKRLKSAIRTDLEKEIKSWANLEIKLGEYTDEYTAEEVDDFILAYQDIKEKLNEYIKQQESLILDDEVVLADAINDVKNFILTINNYFRPILNKQIVEITNIEKHITYDFINFNYTKTLELCLTSETGILRKRNIKNIVYNDNLGDIVYVHGELDKSLLLGVDNESQIINNSFRSNTTIQRMMIKTQTNQEMSHGIPEEVVTLINKSNVICFYGVSIGDSDLSWWQRIGEWLKSSLSKRIIIFSYSDVYIPPIRQHQQLLAEDKIREHFASQAGLTKGELEKLKNRIYICIFKEVIKNKLIYNINSHLIKIEEKEE